MAGSGNNTRNPQNANDNYPAAALRHFHDAEILREADAYENARLINHLRLWWTVPVE